MYGLGWVVATGLIGVVIGLAGGWLLAGRSGRYSQRVETLESELAAARRELDDYRGRVVDEYRETARKFQTLNDAYTDLHRQLAKSSSTLCGDVSGPLLAAPAGHQDLLGEGPPADVEGEPPAHDAAEPTEPDARTDTPGDAPPDRESASQRSL